MSHIYYLPDDVTVQQEAEYSILRTSLSNNIPHIHVCGGKARCSTCRVMVLEGLESLPPRNEKETAMADRLCFPENIRLACQTAPSGPVKVRRLVLDNDDIMLNDQTLDSAKPGAVGTERTVTIMFADIRGFTAFSETHLPYDVIHFLNRYFHRVDQVIRAHGGYIDNYIGDGIMALFGTKDETAENAADSAIAAGLDMLLAVEDMRPYAEEIFNWDFRIGIGIHCGVVVMGSIGSTQRPTETAIGDAVNFASRIEQVNKSLGTELLISRDVMLNSHRELTIGQTVEVDIKGKMGKHMLYEVIGMGQ